MPGSGESWLSDGRDCDEAGGWCGGAVVRWCGGAVVRWCGGCACLDFLGMGLRPLRLDLGALYGIIALPETRGKDTR